MAFLVLLERLSPEQRAAFLLREVFDYPYDAVARIVGTSEANARQLVARARRHVADRTAPLRGLAPAPGGAGRALPRRRREGDLAALEALLSEDVALHGDGGGRVPALARAVYGRAGWRARCPWVDGAVAPAGSPCARSRSTASPAPSSRTGPAP